MKEKAGSNREGVQFLKYMEKYRVHYHHTDRNFNLKLFYLAEYMQETALSAFDRIDGPRREMVEKNLAFVLSKISFFFESEIRKFDDLRVETWMLPAKSISMTRNYRVFNETTGVCAVRAVSSWALVNTVKKTLERPDILSENFTSIDTDDEELGFAPARKIRVPDETKMLLDRNHLFDREVCYSDIDENGHMNNTLYLDIVENALWKTAKGSLPGKLCTLDLSYNNGIVEGDRLSVWGTTSPEGSGTEIFVRGKAGESNCFDAKACFSKK
jgi:acyl-CoA thioesterase FadM